jgi:hypothetical protein
MALLLLLLLLLWLRLWIGPDLSLIIVGRSEVSGPVWMESGCRSYLVVGHAFVLCGRLWWRSVC